MRDVNGALMVGATVLLWLAVSGGAIALFVHGGVLSDLTGTLLSIIALATLFGAWMVWQAATHKH
jgi:hypothetical protein